MASGIAKRKRRALEIHSKWLESIDDAPRASSESTSRARLGISCHFGHRGPPVWQGLADEAILESREEPRNAARREARWPKLVRLFQRA